MSSRSGFDKTLVLGTLVLRQSIYSSLKLPLSVCVTRGPEMGWGVGGSLRLIWGTCGQSILKLG